MATQSEVTEIILMLADAYGKDFQNPKGYLETAGKLLRDVPAVDLRRAAEAHIEKSRFFPAISELKTMARKLPVQAEAAQERPATPLEQIALDQWGIFTGDRSYCRWVEKFEGYTSESQCPEQDRAEYRRWLAWTQGQRTECAELERRVMAEAVAV